MILLTGLMRVLRGGAPNWGRGPGLTHSCTTCSLSYGGRGVIYSLLGLGTQICKTKGLY